MTGPIWSVRDLDTWYTSVRLEMPVSGDMSGPQDVARLAVILTCNRRRRW